MGLDKVLEDSLNVPAEDEFPKIGCDLGPRARQDMNARRYFFGYLEYFSMLVGSM